MAYIEKRQHNNGVITYRARIRIQGMPDESASFPTRTHAKEWARKKESEMKEARYFPRNEGKNRTFAHFVDHYIEKILPKNPDAYTKQKQLMLWWKSHLGSYYLSHITPSMIAELRDQLLRETTRLYKLRSASTVNRYLAALSQAFNMGIKELGWLKENPVLFIQRPKENKARERFLSKEEVSKLLLACRLSKSPYLYAIVLFAISTGARRGEILHLKWTDVDTVQRIAIFRETKNGETRSVSLSSSLMDCLNEERLKRVILSPYIFPNLTGKNPADITSAWKNAVARAGLKNLRFHDLRHTTASHLAMSGASTLEIAAILGHKTLEMVRRYSHLTTSVTAQALYKMNKEIFGT